MDDVLQRFLARPRDVGADERFDADARANGEDERAKGRLAELLASVFDP